MTESASDRPADDARDDSRPKRRTDSRRRRRSAQSTPSDLPERTFAPKLIGVVLAAACLLCAWWSISIYAQWSGSRAALVTTLQQAGVTSQEVYDRVQREPVAHHAQLDTARALVFQLLQASPIESLPAGERQTTRDQRLSNLMAAHELAKRALVRQPNSWEAAMLQGATTYLVWSLTRDRRLFTDASAWQEPLIKAWNEAPGRPEPRRILGTAYLELWPALSPEKRAFATDLLRTTFAADADAFKQLGPAWLEIAADNAEALAIIPDRPKAWDIAARHYAQLGRWRQYSQAYLASLDSLERHLAEMLEDGKTRLELGDVFHSRTRFARVIADATPDQRYAPFVDQALALYPAGLQTAGTGNAMPNWLAWSLELAEAGIASLAPSSIDRLTGALAELPPHAAAMAALAGGSLHIAERHERLERDHTTSIWGPYLITKADHLLSMGELDDAAEALQRVGSASRRRPRHSLVARQLAELREDLPAIAAADRRLDEIRTNELPAGSWRKASQEVAAGGFMVEVLPAQDGDTLAIRVAAAPPEGCVVRVRLDGAIVAVAEVRRAGQELRIETPVSAELHVLEWMTLAGAHASPGTVRIGSS